MQAFQRRAFLPWNNILIRPSVRRLVASKVDSDYDEADLAAARQWLKDLTTETIPQKLCEMSFSRSSGPGGQHVNRTSSKATLRMPTSTLFRLLPEPLHPAIVSSRYYAHTSGDIVIQADDSRKQGANAEECHRRLIEMIREAGSKCIPGETSPEQKAKVRRLQDAEAAARKRMKVQHSAKKAARRGDDRRD